MTRKLAALLLVAAATALASPRARAEGGPGDGGSQTGGAPDAGASDPDQEIVDHLDELENLELLQNLELFDPKPDER